MSTYDPIQDDTPAVIVATFADRERAHRALNELHSAGFRKVWLGITRADTVEGDRVTLEAEDGGTFLESLGRFFGGDDSHGNALYEALVTHGLSEAQARRIDVAISPGNAIVLVEGEYDPPQAMRILKASGGDLASNGTSFAESSLAPPIFREELHTERRRVRDTLTESSATPLTEGVRLRDDAPLQDR